jgi:anti-sigma regulatory factor (Ser/Thr protein kinase)
MKQYSLHFPGTLDSLEKVALFIQQVCLQAELPDDFIGNIALVASEAVTNAIRYGTRSQEEILSVTMDFTSTALSVQVLDHGPGFDPDEVILPDLDYPAEGGYGIYLIKTLMDEVTYSRGNDGNTLRMIKRFG